MQVACRLSFGIVSEIAIKFHGRNRESLIFRVIGGVENAGLENNGRAREAQDRDNNQSGRVNGHFPVLDFPSPVTPRYPQESTRRSNSTRVRL